MNTNPNSNEYTGDDAALERLVDQALDDWKAPEVGASFDRNLLAKIRAENARPSLFTGWRWATAALPALGLAMAIYFWPAAPKSSFEAIQAHELVEVERTLDDLEALQALHQTDAPKEVL